MILDSRVEFADSLAPAAGVLGNVIDLQGGSSPLQARDIGAGQPLYFVAALETVATGGPIDVSLITADNTALTSNPVTLLNVTGFVVTAAGPIIAQALPSLPLSKWHRYLGVMIAGTAAVGGTVSAFLTLDVSAIRQYQDAQN